MLFFAHFWELLKFLLQTYRMCLLLFGGAGVKTTEVCFIISKVLLMQNCQLQNGEYLIIPVYTVD